jgi:hypothetical protein
MPFRLYAVFALLFAGTASAGVEDKYRQLKVILLGTVMITDPHVSIVGAKEISPGVDRVTFLQLDRGIVDIRQSGNADDQEIRAEIGQGTDKDPAVNITGTFEWKDGKLVRLSAEKVHMRLRHGSASRSLLSGKLRLDVNSDIFVDNTSALEATPERATGKLSIATFGSQIIEPLIKFQGVPIKATLISPPTKETVVSVDLSTGQLRAEDGTFMAKTGTEAVPVTNVSFSKDTIKGGNLSLEGIQLVVEHGSLRLSVAGAHIAKPVIQVKGHENVPVVAASEYVARNVRSTLAAEGGPGDELHFDSVTAEQTFATSDPWSVINQLNNLSVFSPEALIPTSNPDLRYIRPQDLAKIYETLAESTPKNKVVTAILIEQNDGVVSRIVVDLGSAPSIKDSLAHNTLHLRTFF